MPSFFTRKRVPAPVNNRYSGFGYYGPSKMNKLKTWLRTARNRIKMPNSYKAWSSRVQEKGRKGLTTLKHKTRSAFGKLKEARMPWNTRFPRARMNANLPNSPKFYKKNGSNNNNIVPLLNNSEKPASLSRQRAMNAPEFNYENLRKLREEPEPKPYKTRNFTRWGRPHRQQVKAWANRKNAAVSTNANNFFGTAANSVNFGNTANEPNLLSIKSTGSYKNNLASMFSKKNSGEAIDNIKKYAEEVTKSGNKYYDDLKDSLSKTIAAYKKDGTKLEVKKDTDLKKKYEKSLENFKSVMTRLEKNSLSKNKKDVVDDAYFIEEKLTGISDRINRLAGLFRDNNAAKIDTFIKFAEEKLENRWR